MKSLCILYIGLVHIYVDVHDENIFPNMLQATIILLLQQIILFNITQIHAYILRATKGFRDIVWMVHMCYIVANTVIRGTLDAQFRHSGA